MGRTHLTAVATALLLGAGALAAAPAGTGAAGWYRIDYAATITDADRELLAAVGADAVQYVPDDAYVAWLDHVDAPALAADASVQAVRPVAPADKLDPHLDASSGQLLALVAADAAASAAGDLAALAPIAGVHASDSRGDLHQIVFDGAPDPAAVAANPAVLYVGPAPTGLFPEDEQATQIVAGNLGTGNKPDLGYEAWLDDLGLDGSGVTVSVVDTGVSEEHPDLGDRVVAKVDYSSTPLAGEPVDVGGHGTHVAGIIGGDATGLSGLGGSRGTDNGGFLYGMGVAPAVQIVDQNAIATTYRGSWPPAYGWARLSADAIDNGANIWNSSWTSGEGTGVGYIASAMVFDALARDGHPFVEGNQGFTFVFSAGNSGSGTHELDTRLTSPKEAKNIIAVAASRNARVGNVEHLASFSSRGPARDGRVAPQVTAPGESIYSSRTMGGAPVASSCSSPPTDEDGLLYGICSGTSMAAPHVTGAVALITQWWRGFNAGADPSPAMHKALLVNTAVDMWAKDIPNRHEGWGRIHLGNLFDPAPSRQYVDQTEVLGTVGETRTYEVTVGADDDVRVTLAWTDAPGAAGAEQALVNDLDLSVTAPDGTVYRGNNFAEGASVAGGAANRIDNLENVFLAAPGAGTYTVTVRAANLPGDGRPGDSDLTDQDYALVVSAG